MCAAEQHIDIITSNDLNITSTSMDRPSHTGNTSSPHACVHGGGAQVGNGARTTLFVDHLLLGRGAAAADDDDSSSSNNTAGGAWRILSKTFAPRPWPSP